MNVITLKEWETRKPSDCPELIGRFFEVTSREVAKNLNDAGILGLSELRNGLEIKAFSHVGRIRFGDLQITVLPKIRADSLLNLLRYAYGFRRLKLISDTTHLTEQLGFEDLLVSQLNSEIQELISRGLLRSYVPTLERLSSPRGRIDLGRMALDGGTVTATLPCQHHPRIEDTLLNQVLMAGLKLAGTLASIVELRRESRKLVSLMDEQVSPLRLNSGILDQAAHKMNRLTNAYLPALSIIRLLVEAQGITLEGQISTISLPGFMFDMNAFFQSLVSRFLRENLPGYVFRDEYTLRGMMRYNPQFNPQRRQSPAPRPDYLVLKQGKICSILDAKYRDLWERPLPREMLYQLVVYAISYRQRPQSSILYPTVDSRAKEARIDVSDIFGSQLGQVCLRPVLLPKIEELIRDNSIATRREREEMARQLAFGGTSDV